MNRAQFLSEIGLGGRHELRTAEHMRIRWIMLGPDIAGQTHVTASARLDYSEDFNEMEIGLYESADGQSSYRSARVPVDAQADEVQLSIDGADFFDRFCESVRLMSLDEITV